jgi:DNA-directed RNA polymerase subunit RPC12/RpoP
MATKTIYMNGDGDEGGYVYPNSDEEIPACENSDQESEDNAQESEDNAQEYPEFYGNLEIIEDSVPKGGKIKNKQRSLSIDSDTSESAKRHNFKCGSCKKSFLLDKNQKMIRCFFCGYRILFKLRTRNYISFKTE